MKSKFELTLKINRDRQHTIVKVNEDDNIMFSQQVLEALFIVCDEMKLLETLLIMITSYAENREDNRNSAKEECKAFLEDPYI